jgi:hypothetical protein
MKNIHVLQTDKPSRLRYFDSKLEIMSLIPKKSDIVFQNIYITTDEEIKEGDWFYVKTPNIQGGNVVLKSLGFGKNCWSENILTETADEKGYDPTHCVRIILTTDQDLIADGVQAIDDEFLEWFVKNPSCESVVVNFNYKKFRWSELNKSQCYKITIPKEEPKQETLEQAAENYAVQYLIEDEQEIDSVNRKQSFKAGATYMAERMYSEEDLREAFRQGGENMDYSDTYGWTSKLTEQEWFEQFKKK